MTQAVAVRRDGDAFQARIFWRKAACLLDPKSPVTHVGFESGPKGFDDVWVAYAADRAPIDQEGRPILREHIQCKWHVSVNDFGHADLAVIHGQEAVGLFLAHPPAAQNSQGLHGGGANDGAHRATARRAMLDFTMARYA